MKRRSDEEISAPLYEYDAAIRAQYGFFAGVDEAGRGPLCGPVVVAACILDPEKPVYGINDSKKLSEKTRERLYDEILAQAIETHIVIVEPQIIDEKNIYRATQEAMQQIVDRFAHKDGVLSDAMPLPACTLPVEPLVKGDMKSVSIAAASILAKVTRDHIMKQYDERYPQYGFARHKGYPTKAHLQALHEYGVLPIHRRSYGPVREALMPHLELSFDD